MCESGEKRLGVLLHDPVLEEFVSMPMSLSYSGKNGRLDCNHSSRGIIARDVRDGIA